MPQYLSARVTDVASTNWSTSQVSVGSTPTLIAAARNGRNAVVVTNVGTTTVYLGGSSVSTSTGAYLAGAVGAAKVVPYSGAVYAVVAVGTQTVTVEELY
jgi:monoamine oxidase